MIWIITTGFLYLLIAAAALFLICSGESDPPKRKEAYYDIRNIGVAVSWPLVMIWAGVKVAAKKISTTTKAEEPTN